MFQVKMQRLARYNWSVLLLVDNVRLRLQISSTLCD